MSEQTDYEENTSKNQKAAKPSDASQKENRLKLQLSLDGDHPLANFCNEIKKRGIKDVEMNHFILEALKEVPTHWWDMQLDQVTPLEYRVNMALNDPAMREKLSKLLIN